MRDLKFFMILIALPALAALGHDLYLFYENQERGFMFSALGFIWTHYWPESFKSTAQALEANNPAAWQILNYILTQKAFFLGLTFAAIIYAILVILRIFCLWPFNGMSGLFSAKKEENTFISRNQSRVKKFKYKRK